MSKLEEQLVVIIEKAISIAEKTGEFVIDQSPDLLREFYIISAFKNVFIILIVLVIYITLIKLSQNFGTKNEPSTGDYDKMLGRYYIYTKDRYSYSNGDYISSEKYSYVVISSIIYSIIAFSIICTYLYDLMYLFIAPKLYLLDKLSDFI